MSTAPAHAKLDRPQTVPVLMYHDVDARPGHGAFAPYVVSPGLLSEHFAAIREAGYETAPISRLADEAPGLKMTYLTFDDAYETFHSRVLPALAENGMSATVFVPTKYVGLAAGWMPPDCDGWRRLASWSDLRDAVSSGSEVGAHGHSHVALDLLRTDSVRAELTQSRLLLEEELCVPVTSMAYPFGHNTSVVRREARRAGYTVACAVADDLQMLSGDLLRVRRILISSTMSAEELLLAIGGAPRRSIDRALRATARPAWRCIRRARARREQTSRRDV
jgi:peptidoglycan/xylan/chitin deacetylase (PgdA/CDA1 family)